jgi:hypothetical protein
MPPTLEKVQKSLPEFVPSHLSVTFLILEGASYNVNQAEKSVLVMLF